ncbi:MAG: hypothetical protein QF415_14970 [Candidatus Undinarchaeales archaeon]|jgi:hypothetical protein|nr:hypothetical protein [Candidatus Undinarchaeales archaeon]MDP7494616.1 hypothetical protein [Candidatus Undinarchaeales archaeon]
MSALDRVLNGRTLALAAVVLVLTIAGYTWLSGPATTGGRDVIDCSLDDMRYGDSIGMDTSRLADLQDELLWCLENERSFDTDRALTLLDSFLLETSTGIGGLDTANPLRANNLAIRSDLIRMLVMRLKDASYAPDLAPVKAKLREFGFTSDDYITWYEGSSYLVYTLAAVRQANRQFDDDDLQKFEEAAERWLADLALPDGTLAPIGDTRLDASYKGARTVDRTVDRVVHTDHETAVFFDHGKGYLLFRHPVNNTKPGTVLRHDLHVPFDFGSVWLWYDGSWRVRPVGYPGYALKTREDLDDRFNLNIQCADSLGNDFTQKDTDRWDLLGYLSSWRATASVVIPKDAVQRAEHADRYELVFSYSLNSGEDGAYERFTRNVTLYKGLQRMELVDHNPGNTRSYLMVSDDINITSSHTVSCGPDGKWSPGSNRVERSRRCSIGGAPVLAYAVRW